MGWLPRTEKYKVATQAEAGYTKRHQGTEIKNLHRSIKLIEGQNECSYLSLHLKTNLKYVNLEKTKFVKNLKLSTVEPL